MADKSIGELVQASSVQSSDLFVLQQSNTAKSLQGQVLLNWLTAAADGHGGISGIEKTGSSGLKDTYRITLADTTTFDFVVTNGRTISSVEKTSSSGFKDTYTITYNDGDTSTFIVTNGRSLNNVEKSSSGLKDSYKMSFNDGTDYSFDLTNGRGISNVEKSSEGLKDTYTITYNDGTSYDFSVDNGKTISKIEKTASSGLTDSYTITYNDGTSSTFTVTNGRGISNVEKSSEGIEDTYTITYNDGTDYSFTLKNGEKGDTGDSWYMWVRYAGSKPTKDSDIGTTPDKWIGIYSGTESTAPTTYTSYSWYQIKGEKGDTGSDLTIGSTTTTYLASTSGTVVPEGSWTDTVPTVAQGSFLWSRTIITFSDGTDSAPAYSVSRYGIDGTGSVSSVNNASPDADGNVSLTASDIPTSSSESIQTVLNSKVDSVDGKGLSANDFTDTLKTELETMWSDWEAMDAAVTSLEGVV